MNRSTYPAIRWSISRNIDKAFNTKICPPAILDYPVGRSVPHNLDGVVNLSIRRTGEDSGWVFLPPSSTHCPHHWSVLKHSDYGVIVNVVFWHSRFVRNRNQVFSGANFVVAWVGLISKAAFIRKPVFQCFIDCVFQIASWAAVANCTF